jgi:acetyl esterase/lipase
VTRSYRPKLSVFILLVVLGTGLNLFAANNVPAPVAVPTRAVNLDPTGPGIPARAATESAHPDAILLWPNGAPGSESLRAEPEHVSWRQEPDLVFAVISNIHNPSLTPFLPTANATGCAVVIAPGGGHMQLTIDREGYDLARWLAERGIAAFVLKYRLARDGSAPADSNPPYTVDGAALADTQRAIRLVRSRATEWKINAGRVGVLGFSAGGELALLAALRPADGQANATDIVDRQNSRPDFFAPIYSGGLQRPNLPVSKSTPPAFLACAYDDRMAEQSASFFIALRQAGVNGELHIYNRGGHGFGVRGDRANLAISTWHNRFVEWLSDRGFMLP